MLLTIKCRMDASDTVDDQVYDGISKSSNLHAPLPTGQSETVCNLDPTDGCNLAPK